VKLFPSLKRCSISVRLLLHATVIFSVSLVSACTSLIPDSNMEGEGLLIVKVDSITSVSPVYNPKIDLEFIDQQTNITVLSTRYTASDVLRSFSLQSGTYNIQATAMVDTRSETNSGINRGNTSTSGTFDVEEGTLLIFDYQLEFLLTGDLEPVCRWQKISSDDMSAIQNEVLINENHSFWNLAEWDSDLDESISFSQ
jgi:hypothetical protein